MIKVSVRVFLMWIAIVITESANGTARRLFLEPEFGVTRAKQFSVVTGSILIFVVVSTMIRWLQVTNAKSLLCVGGALFILTFVFEISLSRALGLTWSEVRSDFDPQRGGYLAFGMIFLAASPWLAFQFREWANWSDKKIPRV